MGPPRLHLIGNAHIDPAWLWRWPEGLSEVLATFRSALDRLAEHPDFVFSCGSAAFYQFVERADPAMFAEIVAAAAEGRWDVLGGFWVEPDTNLSSGEALVRHALLSQRYFESRFGRVPTVAFNPDAFGHCAGLPQILARAGFDAYVFMRPEPSEAPLPRSFRWAAGDGSTVRAYRIPVAYCTWPDNLDAHLAAVEAALRADGEPDGMCFYGVGNHGGGPTRGNLAALDARIAAGQPLRYSSPHRYLSGPGGGVTVDGELGFHARGCYSANSAIKAALRRTDSALVGAEGAASLATLLTGAGYPAAELRRAWEALLGAGFHDVAAGTVIGDAARDALGALAGAAATAERLTDEAYVTLAWHTALAAEPDETVLVVFNPHPWPARGPVEAEAAPAAGPLVLRDGSGASVPVQEIPSQATVGGRRRVTFLAELPASGWSVYRLRTATPEGAGPAVRPPRRELELEIDARTGGIAGLHFDGSPVLAAPSAHTTVGPDGSDTWSHGLASFGPAESGFAGVTVRQVEDGPVRRVVETVARHGRSTLTQRYELYAGWDRLLVRVTCDWAEQHQVAKLRFSTDRRAQVITEVPYASAVRPPDGDEYPGGAWLAATGDTGGFALANDAKFGYDVLPGSVGITIARSPIAAHHDPARPDPEAEADWLDQGRQRFTYAVRAGSDLLGAARLSAELLRPPRAIAGSLHPDAPLAAGVPHLVVTGATLGAFKRAEDGSGTIVRIHNPSRATAAAAVEIGERGLPCVLAPTEVLTVVVPDDPGQPVRRTGLLEGDPRA